MHWLNAGHPDEIHWKVLLQEDEILQEGKSLYLTLLSKQGVTPGQRL